MLLLEKDIHLLDLETNKIVEKYDTSKTKGI